MDLRSAPFKRYSQHAAAQIQFETVFSFGRGSETYLEEVLVAIGLVAESTLEGALGLLGVHSQVLGQICLLREALVAAGLGAHKRPLARVHAQVVEEVVPLAEEHAAVLVVALEYFHLAHRSRVLVLVDAELARARYFLLDLHRTHIVVDAPLNVNLCVMWHLLRHLFVAQVIAPDNQRGLVALVEGLVEGLLHANLLRLRGILESLLRLGSYFVFEWI